MQSTNPNNRNNQIIPGLAKDYDILHGGKHPQELHTRYHQAAATTGGHCYISDDLGVDPGSRRGG